jgi:hypothetical protein
MKKSAKKAAPKKAAKKTAKKAAPKSSPMGDKSVVNGDETGTLPVGDAGVQTTETEAPMSDAELASVPAGRRLVKGTLVQLAGSNRFLELQSDVQVVGDGMAKDETFVGLLARNRTNFDLNIGAIEGTWSPITARREED